MSKHYATIDWKNNGPDFLNRKYSREHTWLFDGGASIAASPSPLYVPVPWSNAALIDPEEAFIASVASCHMLWVLHVAINAGFLVLSYEDKAEGVMTKNDRGGLWISLIILRPHIVWGGDKMPSLEDVAYLHHLAHEQCFIANSIKTEIKIEMP